MIPNKLGENKHGLWRIKKTEAQAEKSFQHSRQKQLKWKGASENAVEKTHVLNRIALLSVSHSRNPEHVTQARLTGLDIDIVIQLDMTLFKNLTHLYLGENHINMNDLLELSSLKVLSLACNGIIDIELQGGFFELETLDLSFNMLNSTSLEIIGQLPKLRHLDLTCNEIVTLPNLSGYFEQLELLILEQNSLDNESIQILSSLSSLTELNLSKNNLVEFPVTSGFSRLKILNLEYNLIPSIQVVESIKQNFELLEGILTVGNPFEKTEVATELQEESESKIPFLSKGGIPVPPEIRKPKAIDFSILLEPDSDNEFDELDASNNTDILIQELKSTLK